MDLAQKGKSVTILEKAAEVLPNEKDMPLMNHAMLLDLMNYYHVKIIADATIQTVDKNIIKYHHNGMLYEINTDSVVSLIGFTSNDKLYKKLRNIDKPVYVLGDAKRVKNIMNAVWDAYELGTSILSLFSAVRIKENFINCIETAKTKASICEEINVGHTYSHWIEYSLQFVDMHWNIQIESCLIK